LSGRMRGELLELERVRAMTAAFDFDPLEAVCELCACTEDEPCLIELDGAHPIPCSWVDENRNVCTACAVDFEAMGASTVKITHPRGEAAAPPPEPLLFDPYGAPVAWREPPNAAELERLAATAYIGHLDHCQAGCRPEVNRGIGGYREAFIPGTGNGCPHGLQLARAWQRAQDLRRGGGDGEPS
jgi:hypothetical protein